MARSTYGYGVDLRRTRWLTASVIGQAPLRALEHAWFSLAETLMTEELRVPDQASDIPILSEVIAIARLLGTTPPAIRILRESDRAQGAWGLVTPLGDPRGSNEWLVLDLQALSQLADAERLFLLGEGLGHLHCGHGALFLAHLVGERRGGHGLLRRLLKPWTRVASFSADRAGLLAAGDLGASLLALEHSVAAAPPWSPRFASPDDRRISLEEFASTTVAARFRARRLREAREEVDLAADLEALAGPPPQDADAEKTETDAEKTDAETDGSDSTPPADAQPDEADDDELEGVPDDAWTIARCDHRLTTRLRLL